MKKLLLIVLACSATLFTFSQETPPKKKKVTAADIRNRANDHLLIQYGWHGWAQKPDSINTRGFSKTFNIYVMIDFPFKTDPRFSVAVGPGIGTDHMFFEKTSVGIANHTTNDLRFLNQADTNHFDKYKLVSAYLELPVELRFNSNPLNARKGFKVAIGMKVGLLTDIHTKGKNFVDKAGNTIVGFDEKFIQKQKDKHYFNSNRLVAIGRIGWGNFTVFGSYQLGPLIKEGLGPNVKPVSIGLTLSGL